VPSAAAPIAAAPPPTPPAPLSEAESIERLALSKWEQQDLERLPALFRTPRTVKRFLNTYRFLRAGLPPTERHSFVGTADDPGEYRVVLVLLAVVVSFSNLAPLFLQRLLNYSDGTGHRTWRAFIESLQREHARPRRSARASARTAAARSSPKQDKASEGIINEGASPNWEEAEWRNLCAVLAELSAGQDSNGNWFTPTELDRYLRWTPVVARYSFSLSALLAMRR
jgi:hypothetical protein